MCCFENESSCIGNTTEYHRKWKSWILNFGELLFTYQTIQSIILKPCFEGMDLVFRFQTIHMHHAQDLKETVRFLQC